MHKRLFVPMAALAAALGPDAAAQEADTAGITLLPTIRIDSSGAQSLLGNDTISEEEIERRNADSVRDIFAGESSITTGGGAAIANKVFVNGIEESLLSVTIDGARQNKSAFHHTGNVLIDPSLLKRVEVTKGLAPADAGPGALGGSIAYELKDASDLLEDGDDFGGRLTIGGIPANEEVRGNLTLFGRVGGWDWLVSGVRHVGEDYENGSGVTVPGTQPDLSDFTGKTSFTTDSGNKLTLSASQTEDTGLRAVQNGFARPDFAGIVGTTSDYEEALSRRRSYTLTFDGDGFEGWLDPTAQISYNEQEMDVVSVSGVNTSLSGFLKNEFGLSNGSVTAGFDFFNESAEGYGLSSGTETLFDAGAFAQFRQDLTDRVSVTYGARYDWQSFDGADGSNFKDSGASVNGAVDFILTDTLTLNAGAATTWGGYELGEAALINFGQPWDYTGFSPSRSRSYRLGLRYENGPWQASGALFRTEIDDIAAVLPSSNGTVRERGALSSMTSAGVEATFGYHGDRGYATASFTYADVQLDGSDISTTSYYYGRPVGSMAALEIGWDVTEELQIGGSAEFAFQADLSDTTLPGYEVFNAFIDYRPERFSNLDLRLDVENIFNETYASRSSDGIDLTTKVVPLTEPGRTFRLTATMDF